MGGRTRAAWTIVLALPLLGCAGCEAVDFTQRRDLADPVMSLQEDPLEARFRSKAAAAREGGIGVGTLGAGGCGCY
jgi:hypothetical protein